MILIFVAAFASISRFWRPETVCSEVRSRTYSLSDSLPENLKKRQNRQKKSAETKIIKLAKNWWISYEKASLNTNIVKNKHTITAGPGMALTCARHLHLAWRSCNPHPVGQIQWPQTARAGWLLRPPEIYRSPAYWPWLGGYWTPWFLPWIFAAPAPRPLFRLWSPVLSVFSCFPILRGWQSVLSGLYWTISIEIFDVRFYLLLTAIDCSKTLFTSGSIWIIKSPFSATFTCLAFCLSLTHS